MPDLVYKGHLVSGVLVLERFEHLWGHHARVGGSESGLHGITVRVSPGWSWREMTIKASGLTDHAIGLDVVEGDERSPERGLCRAEGRACQEKTKGQDSRALQNFTAEAGSLAQGRVNGQLVSSV